MKRTRSQYSRERGPTTPSSQPEQDGWKLVSGTCASDGIQNAPSPIAFFALDSKGRRHWRWQVRISGSRVLQFNPEAYLWKCAKWFRRGQDQISSRTVPVTSCPEFTITQYAILEVLIGAQAHYNLRRGLHVIGDAGNHAAKDNRDIHRAAARFPNIRPFIMEMQKVRNGESRFSRNAEHPRVFCCSQVSFYTPS